MRNLKVKFIKVNFSQNKTLKILIKRKIKIINLKPRKKQLNFLIYYKQILKIKF
jgi:hypothetical protein